MRIQRNCRYAHHRGPVEMASHGFVANDTMRISDNVKITEVGPRVYSIL